MNQYVNRDRWKGADVDWTIVVEDIGPKLFRYFSAVVPQTLASDLVQETLLRLVQKYENGQYKPEKGSLRMFAFGIARFVRLEALKALPKEDYFSDPSEYEWQIDQSNIEEHTKINERKSLRNAIALLNEPQKEIILLLVDKDLPLQEIGEILNMPSGTVKSHVHRAKAKLKEILNQGGNAHE